jgi:hypothetical protein
LALIAGAESSLLELEEVEESVLDDESEDALDDEEDDADEDDEDDEDDRSERSLTEIVGSIFAGRSTIALGSPGSSVSVSLANLLRLTSTEISVDSLFLLFPPESNLELPALNLILLHQPIPFSLSQQYQTYVTTSLSSTTSLTKLPGSNSNPSISKSKFLLDCARSFNELSDCRANFLTSVIVWTESGSGSKSLASAKGASSCTRIRMGRWKANDT